MGSTFNTTEAAARMRRRRLTYADIGRVVGKTRQAVGHWFRNRGEPDVDDIKKMAPLLGVHWVELVQDGAVIANSPVEIEIVKGARELDARKLEQLRQYVRFLQLEDPEKAD